MTKIDWRERFPDEVADFKPIPKWFTKFIKKPKRTFILVSRGYGSNWFYNWWKSRKNET